MCATVYKSKIDWWVYAIGIGTVLYCVLMGLIVDSPILLALIGFGTGIFLIIAFGSVSYQICDNKLGVRNIFYHWEWFPIDKIAEVKKSGGILAAPALSTKRISIKFSDRKILKSSMPMEISPKHRDAFIAHLKEINPRIEVK